jgi:hypothetical protein
VPLDGAAVVPTGGGDAAEVAHAGRRPAVVTLRSVALQRIAEIGIGVVEVAAPKGDPAADVGRLGRHGRVDTGPPPADGFVGQRRRLVQAALAQAG